MAIKGSGSPMEAVDEYFDMLIKSRFIEMFGHINLNEKNLPMKTLNEVCLLVTDGSHYSPADEPDGKYPMLSVKDLSNGKFNYSDCKHINQGEYDKLVKDGCKPIKNDVLIAKDGSVFQKSMIITDEIDQVILSSIAIIRPDTDVANPVYLERYLMSDYVKEDVINNYTTGTAIRRIILKNLAKLKLIVPEIEAQNEFASFVQQVDKSKAIVQKCIDKYDLLVKSRFIEMFGTRNEYAKKWQMKPFTACCDVLYGYPFNSQLFNDNGEGMPLIRVRDINTAFSNTYTTENVSPIYQVHDGDILVGMDGDFYAKIWSSGTALLNQRTCKMKGRRDVVNDLFMLHYLNPELLEIHRNTASTTVKHLSAKEINKMQMPLPPIELQEHFVAFVKQVDKSKFEVVQSLLRLKSKYIRTETPSKRTDCDL